MLTFIAAPALLTNASSVLAMSTINRMLRTRDRMHALYSKFEQGGMSDVDYERLVVQVDRVERQAELLLKSLHAVYVALGAFAGATLLTLLGATLAHYTGFSVFNLLGGLGLGLGFVGVGGLVFGSFQLFQANQLSLLNMRAEAEWIRQHQQERKRLKEGKAKAEVNQNPVE